MWTASETSSIKQMKPKYKIKSPVDSIIIDLILDHFNIQSMTGKRETITGDEFVSLCRDAERLYFNQIMITEEPGVT
tara:strand:+ start:148 stop:378 length:231 start_codon:yes stop_codon:yes gene_type:complete